MRRAVIFATLMIICGSSFSQIFTIEVLEVHSLVGEGSTTLKEILDDPDVQEPMRSVNCRYILDLSKGTSTFYRDGKFISEITILAEEVSPGVYSIKARDKDLETGSLSIETSMVLDTDPNSGKFLYMYFDPINERTVVDVITKYTILRPV